MPTEKTQPPKDSGNTNTGEGSRTGTISPAPSRNRLEEGERYLKEPGNIEDLPHGEDPGAEENPPQDR